MKIGTRIKQLRTALGISQEVFGAQGIISTPGYIKVENGQRSPSEKLLFKIVEHYAQSKKLSNPKAADLLDELLTLKYLGDTSPFVRMLATAHAKTRPNGDALLTADNAVPKRGRPADPIRALTGATPVKVEGKKVVNGNHRVAAAAVAKKGKPTASPKAKSAGQPF